MSELLTALLLKLQHFNWRIKKNKSQTSPSFNLTVFLSWFILGIISVLWWPEVFALSVIFCLLAGCVVIKLFMGRGLVCIAFLLGLLWATWDVWQWLNLTLPAAYMQQPIAMHGKISEILNVSEQRTRFIIKPENRQLQSKPSDLVTCVVIKKRNCIAAENIILTWYGEPPVALELGQQWQFWVKLKEIHGVSNPGALNWEKWAFRRHISARGWVLNYKEQILLSQDKNNLALVRIKLIEKIRRQLSDYPSHRIMIALLFGDRTGLMKEDWQVLARTGTSHLIAISGLHLTLVTGSFLFCLQWALRRFKWQLPKGLSHLQISLLVSLGIATFYALLSGLALPVKRALWMYIILVMVLWWQRNLTVFDMFVLVVAMILIQEPREIIGASFWLSFTAVAIILWSTGQRTVLPVKFGRLRSFIKIQWLLWIGLMPVLIIFFKQVSLLAPLINLVAIPMLFVILISLLALFGTWLVWPSLGNIGLVFMAQLLDHLWQGLIWLSQLEMSTVTFSMLSAWQWCALCLVVAVCLLPRGLPAKWIGLFSLLPNIFIAGERLEPGQIKLTMLDVSQGLSVVVQTMQHTLIYDVGNDFGDFDYATAVVVPYLKQQGIKQVNSLILSHWDADHSGAAADLLAQFPVMTGYHLPDSKVPNVLQHIPWQNCLSGHYWQWDQVNFSFIYPEKNATTEGNTNVAQKKIRRNLSCVLKIEGKDFSVLLPGDISRAMEEALLQNQKPVLAADVLLVPHHGSDTSSSTGFIHSVAPKVALVSAGYGNQFGHPHQQVVSRYRNRAIEFLNTAYSGAIEISANRQGGLQITSHRALNRHYWQRVPKQ